MKYPAVSILIFTFAFTISPATGRAISPQEAIRQQEIIQQREEQRRLELERRHRESLETPPAPQQVVPLGKATGPEDQRCFQVQKIVLQGATLLSEREQQRLTQPYAGKCLTLTDINNLVRDITNAYIEKGYVTTRAAVPQQDISGGVLTILVIEGRVENIEFKEDTPSAARKLMLAFPGVTGGFLNIRDIEQGLDQLNSLPSNNAKVDLLPGATPGTSRVVIDNKAEKTWRAMLGLDNSGQKSTGEVQYLLGLEKDNLLGINDLLSVNYNGDFDSMVLGEHQDSQSLSTFYSFGVGYWTFIGSWSRFDYRTKLEDVTPDFTSSGVTTTSAFSSSYVFHRDADSKSSIGAGLTYRDTDNYLSDIKLKASSYRLAVLALSATHTQRLLGGVLTLNAEYRRGLAALGVRHDANDLDLATPKAEFDKIALTATAYRPFRLGGLDFSWSTKLWGQWTPDTLYSAERASIGSRYTVRGFQNDSLDGDIGGYIRNELALTLPLGRMEGLADRLLNRWQVYAGYDAGFIWKDPKDDYEHGTVQGAALGMRTFGTNLLLDCAVSKALAAPAFVKTDEWDVFASAKITF